jgi:hypothetical protein
MKRGFGMGLVAFLLGWLSLAGFANAYFLVAPMGYRQIPEVAAAGAWRWVLAGVALSYGITAAMAAAGAWRLSPWAPRAVLWWGVTVMSLGLLFIFVPPWSAAAWYQHLTFLAVVAGIVLFLKAFVQRRVVGSGTV